MAVTTYLISQNDLTILGSPDIVSFDGRDLKMFPIEYSVDKSDGGKILSVEYVDSSVRYLDKKFVVLADTHIRGKSNGPNDALIAVGQKYWSDETEEGRTWTFTTADGRLSVASDDDTYQTWIDSFASLTDPADKLPDADPDRDGLPNSFEMVLGGDPANGSDAAIAAVDGVVILTDDDFAFTPPPVAPATTADWGRVFVPRGSNTRLFGRLDVTVP